MSITSKWSVILSHIIILLVDISFELKKNNYFNNISLEEAHLGRKLIVSSNGSCVPCDRLSSQQQYVKEIYLYLLWNVKELFFSNSVREKVFSETNKTKALKMDWKIDCHKVAWQTLHSISSIQQILFELLQKSMFKWATFREILLPSSGPMMGEVSLET